MKTMSIMEWGPYQFWMYAVWGNECTNDVSMHYRTNILCIHQKFFIIYLDDIGICGPMNKHMELLELILNICYQNNINLYAKKYVFIHMPKIKLLYIICKQGILLYLTKIKCYYELNRATRPESHTLIFWPCAIISDAYQGLGNHRKFNLIP